MIPGELRNSGPTHQVKATVADVREIDLAASQHEGGAGCTHPVKLGMLLSIVLDAFVGGREGAKQSCLRSIAEALVVDFADSLDCQTARFLAAFVSAHAIGNYGQPALALELLIAGGLPIEVRIFIVLTLPTDVGQASHFNAGS